MRNIGKLVYVHSGVISNLTKHQQEISKTGKFKKWFENSIIEDQFKEP